MAYTGPPAHKGCPFGGFGDWELTFFDKFFPKVSLLIPGSVIDRSLEGIRFDCNKWRTSALCFYPKVFAIHKDGRM